MKQTKYAPAYEHGPITKLFDKSYWVHGSIKMAPGMTMNRNMVILKQQNDLFLVNPIRLNEDEEHKLAALGKVACALANTYLPKFANVFKFASGSESHNFHCPYLKLVSAIAQPLQHCLQLKHINRDAH